ncbi:hypothetical protein [Pontivivens ytuae]|uniref:Uncharacterized protein n=1 Tax=Pontivivens ytuae TaxID=2789856 RepID=A0A7S9QE09_9RHOB|nr:hypothetical protein [Pontivivens ytuae]QPH54907.1 hypothetical protein I0K15_03820 [Pontivivens ytuae]
MRISILAACVFAAAGQAASACGELIQSCTFEHGRDAVRICLIDGFVTYDYGPAGGPPELSLSVPIEEADYYPWSGSGSTVWEMITFHNEAYAYHVAAGFHKLREGEDTPRPPFGSIEVTYQGDLISSRACDAGSVQWGYGDGGLYGAKTAAGLCWADHPDFVWRPCAD